MMSAIRGYFFTSPAILAIFITLNSSSQAAVPSQADRQQQSWEQVADAPSQPLTQVNSTSESSDVKPTDWAFLALQSLVKNYGCAGYPNAKFPGNQSITRDEFAHALNACRNRVNELLATTADSDVVKKEDLVNIKKLQQAFQVELAKLWGHDAVAANTPSVPANQSSPTTKPSADKPPELNPKPDANKKQVAENSNAHFQSQVTKLATQIPEKETTVAPIGIKQLTAKTETVAVPVPGTVEMSADKLQPSSPTSDSPVSQAPAIVPPATPTPAKKQKYKFSYLGIGVNFGSGGQTSALGATSFAAFSKFALSPSFSIRPALLVNQNQTVLLPITYNFPISGPGHIDPYIGLGMQSSSPFSSAFTKSDLLLTGGIDYPINSHLALTAGVNLGTFNSSGVGGLLGLAYIFNTAPGLESSTTSAPEPGTTPDQAGVPEPGTTPDQAEKEHHITENWNAHVQGTFIYQDKPGFNALYSGANSLPNTPKHFTYSYSFTGFFGVRLWQSGEFYLDPEISSGITPSDNLIGLAFYPDGEDQKSASLPPLLYMARAFLRQTWNLGGNKTFVESGQNQLAEDVSSQRLVLTVGKLAETDLYGPNQYSGSPRTQFFNYAFLTYGAFDYASNARGYTVGAALEYFLDKWTFRLGRFALTTISNGPTLDWNLLEHYNDAIEIERSYVLAGQTGKLRIMGFHDHAVMASFQDALNQWQANGEVGVPNIANVRNKEQDQYGFGIGLEQSLGRDVGLFVFGSWNDGRTENYSYIDAERSLTTGLSIQGTGWGRPRDTLGLGYAMDGIGSSFRQYLAYGGLGTFVGDGNLNYHPEKVFETYYNLSVTKSTTLGLDFQYLRDPGYNSDRGPVFFGGVRLHFEI
ncbi:MAG: iron uptake porin [Nostoc sp.]|uniref:iron uptake porin n=1 Tax=Nostoc sp. TaxID=1180 RepID=UPI002FF3DB99